MKATYQPVSRVVTDSEGHYLETLICDCDHGSHDWTPDTDSCPVHREDR